MHKRRRNQLVRKAPGMYSDGTVLHKASSQGGLLTIGAHLPKDRKLTSLRMNKDAHAHCVGLDRKRHASSVLRGSFESEAVRNRSFSAEPGKNTNRTPRVNAPRTIVFFVLAEPLLLVRALSARLRYTSKCLDGAVTKSFAHFFARLKRSGPTTCLCRCTDVRFQRELPFACSFAHSFARLKRSE